MAGLLSDTPPSSPYCAAKDSNEDESFQAVVINSLDSYAQINALNPKDTEQDASLSQISEKAIITIDCMQKERGAENLIANIRTKNFNATDMPINIEQGQNLEKTIMANDCMQNENTTENLITDLRMENIIQTDMPLDTDQDAYMTRSSEKAVMAIDCIQKESGTENLITDDRMEIFIPKDMPESVISNDHSLEECEVDKKPLITQTSERNTEVLKKSLPTEEDNDDSRILAADTKSSISGLDDVGSEHIEETLAGKIDIENCSGHNAEDNTIICHNLLNCEQAKLDNDKSHISISISKMVEVYIKEHIRPLCKSGVITVDQYRWAVAKTLDKVMKFHHKAKNANFLIRKGKKVKKLAEQYVEAAQHKELK